MRSLEVSLFARAIPILLVMQILRSRNFAHLFAPASADPWRLALLFCLSSFWYRCERIQAYFSCASMPRQVPSSIIENLYSQGARQPHSHHHWLWESLCWKCSGPWLVVSIVPYDFKYSAFLYCSYTSRSSCSHQICTQYSRSFPSRGLACVV